MYPTRTERTHNVRFVFAYLLFTAFGSNKIAVGLLSLSLGLTTRSLEIHFTYHNRLSKVKRSIEYTTVHIITQ